MATSFFCLTSLLSGGVDKDENGVFLTNIG